MSSLGEEGAEPRSFEELSAEEKDFELARRLQEQEAVFYHFYGNRQEEEGGEPLGFDVMSHLHGRFIDAIDSSESDGIDGLMSSAEYIPVGHQEEQEDGNEEEVIDLRDSDQEDENSSGPASQIDDAEFARRLHLQEQVDHRRRMMEMAGVLPDEEGSYDPEDDDEDDDEDESSENDGEPYFTDDSIDPDEMTYEELRALGDTVGVVSKGLAPQILQDLPQAKYIHPSARESEVKRIKGPIHRGHDKDEQCAICRMEFETKNMVKVLPCKHIFHPPCVDQWLAINKACPICGKEVGASEKRQSDTEEHSQLREHIIKL